MKTNNFLTKYGIVINAKTNMVIIGDFARDLDDEHTLLISAILHKLGLINLLAVVGNLKPAKERAMVAKGTLKLLGLGDVLVGVGTDVFSGSKTFPYEAKVPYMADESEIVDGYELLVKTLESAEPKSITLVLQSGLTDAVNLLRTQEKLFKDKIALVAIMGGVQEDENELMFTGKYIQPDDAANITYDWSSGVWLYARLEELNIATSILTRFAVYASQVPFEMYDKMELTGNPVGRCLKDRQKPALQSLWEATCSPANSEIRGSLPPGRDRKWFVKTFCNGVDPQIDDGADIWPYVGKFNLYDPMNFISAIPVLRDRFFEPSEVIINDAKHQIIGISAEVHGVKDVEGLRQFLVEAEVEALK